MVFSSFYSQESSFVHGGPIDNEKESQPVSSNLFILDSSEFLGSWVSRRRKIFS